MGLFDLFKAQASRQSALEDTLRESLLGTDTVSVSRTIYVNKNVSVGGDGSAAFPFKTIQAALDYVAATTYDATGRPYIVKVAQGKYEENLVYNGRNGLHLISDDAMISNSGVALVAVSPTTGVPLTLTNSTLVGLAAFRSSGLYSDLVNQGNAGPTTVFIQGIGFHAPAAGTPNAVELLGVKGDVSGTETAFLSNFQMYRCAHSYTAPGVGIYAKNAYSISDFNNTVYKAITALNCSYIVVRDGFLATSSFSYDSASVDGKSAGMSGVGLTLDQVKMSNGSLTLSGGSTFQANNLLMNSGTLTIEGAGIAFVAGYDFIKNSTVHNVALTSTIGALATLKFMGSQITGAVSAAALVSATFQNCSLLSTLTVTSGAGVVTLQNTTVLGAITDTTMKIVKTGVVADLLAWTSQPKVRGYTGGVDGMKADGSVDLNVVGSDLLQGQAFASMLVGTSLNIYSVVPGSGGNALKAEVVDSGIGGLAVSYAAPLLTIEQGGSGSDESTVATAINALAGCHGILRANSGGGGAVPVTPEAFLTGGVGAGFTVYTGGVAAEISHDTGATSVANLTETTLKINTHDLTAHGFVAKDHVAIEVVSNGKVSMPLAVPLIA